MAVPTTQVFIKFSATLIDVTQYVQSVSINRGKSREQNFFTAGNATVVFHNDSRVFDPFYISSPYYGNVLPRKEVVIKTSSVTQFTGFIDDWDFNYELGNKSFATISCVDAFLQLTANELDAFTTTSQLSGARINAILNRAEVNWPAGSRDIDTGLVTLQADAVAENQNVLSYLQLVEQTEVGSLFIAKDGKLTFRDRANYPPLIDILTFTDETVETIPSRTNLVKNPNFTLTRNEWATVGSITSFIRRTDDGQFGSTCLQIAKQASANSGISTNLTDGSRISVTAGQTYRFSIYVRAVDTGAGSGDIIGLNLKVLNFRADNSQNSSDTSGNFAFEPSEGWQRIDFSFTPVAGANPTTTVALQVIEYTSFAKTFRIDGALAEQSSTLNTFFDGDSIAASWDGTAQDSSSTIPPITVAPYNEIDVVYGSENLANRVVITRLSGTPQQADSTASQAIYGIQSTSLDGLLFNTDTEALSVANYLLGQRDEPELRFSKLTVQLENKSGDQLTNLLDTEINDVYKISFTPNNLGDAIEQYGIVTGINQSIGIDRHSMSFEFGGIAGFAFILDDSFYGILGGLYDGIEQSNSILGF